ncbi:ABC transporter permease [Tabrizicola soli]|uniref:ABC transporter permease n=1 Tax=Tabrizicola soli TaxID=2185115 RepID=A0ABV7DZG4_9RHOB|nr:ABC transporter permease subunit [Tabrizicola soli]
MIRSLMLPRRLAMLAILVLIVALVAVYGRWDWLANPKYQALILRGIGNTLILLVLTMGIGMALAIPLGLAQAVGPWYLAVPARAFCGLIRGTPLLLQLFLLYYGIGSLFPGIPGIRDSFLWPVLRDAWYYAVLGLSLSVAGYEGEVMRGAFKAVPHGQLEAARAMGMPRLTMFRRIWLPQALHRVLPTLGGETVLQLKATPLVALITVVDIYAVASRVRSETLITYEPLMLLAVVYMAITGLIVLMFRWFEGRVPQRVA